MRTKEQIIEEIRQKCSTLDSDISAWSLANRVQQILTLLAEVENVKPGCTGDARQALFHTLNKEVEYAKYDEEKMNKKNAAKIRKTEFKQSMQKAISQIRQDLLWII